jgi:TonB-linked SusC/RagA family outer membrane protein
MRKIVSLTAMLLLFFTMAIAQSRTITGKVTEESGTPIGFASITLKNSKAGTSADVDGKFTIAAKPGDVLIVSAVGFNSIEVRVGNQPTIAITLTNAATKLDEVVVTTAGGIKAKRREIGTANTVIKSEVLNAGRAVSAAAGLQGKVAGFEISGTGSGVNPSYRLILRGQRSLTGNNQALIVLDNVIVPNSVLSNLNPQDVEELVILNGAGAAALYGSQASNGAVIVTTKKGKKGVTQVAISNTTTVESVAYSPKLQTKFGSGGTAYGLNANGNPNFNYLENQSYGPAFDGSKRALGPALEDGSQDSTTYDYKPGHMDFWQKGITNQTDFSISNGDDKSTFYLSGQYANVTGTTPGDAYNRTTLRINGTRKIGNNIVVSYSTGYTQNRYDISSVTGSIYGNLLNMPSNVHITKYKNWRTDKFANPNGFYNPWYQNPYFSADNYRSKQRNDYLVGNIEVKYTPIAGWDLIARQGITTRNYSNKNTIGAFKYTDFAKNTDQSSKTDISAAVGEGSNYQTNLLSDFLTQYIRRVGKFSINAIAGMQWTQNQAKYVSMAANGLVVDGLYNVSNGVGTPSVGESDYMSRQMGVYGDIKFGYNNYLFLHATGRNDWDSRLNSTNNKFFYPAVDASFIASDAFNFIKESKVISFLKIRGGWSKVGQVNLGNTSDFGAYYLKPIFYQTNGFPYGSLAGFTVGNSLVYSNLKPEITQGYEGGFDINFFKDRIITSVTYFSTKTTNQTVPVSISNTTGFTQLTTNVGRTSSRGLELTAHFVPVQTRNWNVTVGGNYSYLDNKVDYIATTIPYLTLSSTGTAYSAAIAGQAFSTILGYDYVRDAQGHVIVNAQTGLPSVTSGLQQLGNTAAKSKLGLDGSISYKNFHLSFLFEYRGGYNIYNGIGTELDWSGTGYRTAVYDRKSFVFPNSVYEDPSKPGTYIKNTAITIANGNGNNGFWTDNVNRGVTSNYVTSANFWKLREISIGYDVPASLLARTKAIKSATISIQGRNLFMWLAKDNIYTDPEYSAAGSDNNGIGLNSLDQTPPSRFYGATISVKF